MGAAEQRQKDSAMAAHLVRAGIFHGKRTTHPSPGSGGYPVNASGSAAYRRRIANKTQGSPVAPAPKLSSLRSMRAADPSGPARVCMACGSPATTKTRRALTCRSCDVTYLIPALRLVGERR